MPPTFIIGDIHGHYKQLTKLLWLDGGLVDKNLRWQGADATLCFLGDYFDRGPDGVSVVRLIMRLQREAAIAGGRVIALLGNHEVAFLGAYRFSQGVKSSPFFSAWLMMGGQLTDYSDITEAHIQWLVQRPLMQLVANRLLIHADAMLYPQYGDTIEAVNAAVRTVLKSDTARHWDTLLERFSEKYAFSDSDWYGDPKSDGIQNAQTLLNIYGGQQIIHGHTPIFRMNDQLPETVNEAVIYADGLAVNVDHGMYKGGSGFIYEVPSIHQS